MGVAGRVPAAPSALRVALMRARACAALLAFTAACGDDAVPTTGPASLTVGPGFDVRVDATSRLVVASHDGRVLLDGLPPGEVTGDGPPLVGFAARQTTTSYEMQFGAIKPNVEAGSWRVDA